MLKSDKYTVVDPASTPLPQFHQLLLGSVGPRPICFASTVNAKGQPNLAPFSFFNVASVNPPILVFAPNNSGRDGSPKQTYLNAKEVPEVVVNIVSFDMVEQMNVTAAPWEHGISEFEKAGFTALKSELVKPFRVAESPVQIECKVLEIKEFGQGGGSGKLIMAQVLKMHIKENVLGADGKIDPFKIDLVGRMGGSWYCRPGVDSMFQLAQPMTKTVGYDQLPSWVKSSNLLSANDLGKLCGLGQLPSTDEMALFRNLNLSNDEKVQRAKQFIAEGETAKALAVLLA